MAVMKLKSTVVSSNVVKGKFAKIVSTKLPASKRPAAADVEVANPEAVVDEAPEVTMKKPAAVEGGAVVKGKFAKAVSTKLVASKRPAAATEGTDCVAPKKGKVSEKAAEDNALRERTKELKSMLVADLKDLARSKELNTGAKADMIAVILALEAKDRDAAKAYAAKAKEVEVKLKADFATKSSPDLKELCDNKGLKKSGPKDELITRLVEQAKANGDVEKILAGIAREARKQELSVLEKGDLQKLCEKAGVDPLVKEVMVERLLMTEVKV